ncbi:ABC transporter ATP-binding protein [Halococcoides cellulosivorans]|uniref:ABC transporter ATP-binding protein n=1 Tax=Halococcoides cellulosivorans TaxID=1679096 RepID=A0A2R4WXW0_9EURY|nr:ABC transporter ATP-binding protein [Halococcoides cellulosivorans]AWB26377.1 ABC transporter ATP-binding protein [Halococcoides cellulosivorans]
MAAIETDGLTKYYGDVRGVEDLSFSVAEGEVFGFLGPNGAGKTTTIRTLMGFQSPTEGSATVLGADLLDRGALRAARARVGYLPSEPAFDEGVSGRRLLEYHGALRGDVRSDELLDLFDPPLDRKVREYSRGNKQMLAIVLAFMHDPDLLIMDEPTSGLDPLKQEELLEFIRSEQQRGKTFFFSSHILSEVRKVCDRVGIVRDGHLVELEDIESLIDRSGKTVRARIAGDVGAAAFDLDGVHDVEIGGDGVSDDADSATAPATTLSFTYTGAYEPLLERVLDYEILDLTIEEAPLEDVFMRFYGEDPAARVDQVENGASDRASGADGPGAGGGGDRASGAHAERESAESSDV